MSDDNTPDLSKKAVAEEMSADELELVSEELQEILYTGPLPPPEQLEVYERLMPGATKAFFEMFKKQSEHRQFIEREVVMSNVRSTTRGQWMAFTLFGTVAVLGFVTVFLGYTATGLIASMSNLAGVLALFFNRRSKYDKELREKNTP